MKLRSSLPYSILIIVPLLSGFLSWKDVDNEKYILDQKESVVTWKGYMQLVPANAHNGYVYMSKGELTIEKDQLMGGTVEVDMKTLQDHSHESDNDLISHLKSADFFDVEKFPTSAFTITKIDRAKDGSINVTGDLTIKGITHAVTFPAKVEVSAGVASATGKVTIDRTKWDVRYNSGKFFANLADETISDNIELNMKIVARKQ